MHIRIHIRTRIRTTVIIKEISSSSRSRILHLHLHFHFQIHFILLADHTNITAAVEQWKPIHGAGVHVEDATCDYVN